MNKYTKSYWGQLAGRLRKNKGAMLGAMVILIVLLAAVFCYVIAPDDSPNADFQTVEIQAKPPGFKQCFIFLPDAEVVEKTGWLDHLLGGTPINGRYIPITQHQIQNDSVIVLKYIDEGVSEKIGYSFHQLLAKDSFQVRKSNLITKTYWLGTDKFGRDILSRLLVGARVSLSVGLVAVLISLLLGVLLGALAGYFGGRTDAAIMAAVNVTWSIPTLLLVFAITLALGKGFWQIFFAVGLTMWVGVARLIRSQVLGIKQLEYVQAARVLGFSNVRIIFRHILPNCMGPLIVLAANNFATAIMVEAGLSFLGIGVQPPEPSWGLMIKENYNFIITHRPLLALVPGIAIMLLVLAFNLLGNGLRDAFDVKQE